MIAGIVTIQCMDIILFLVLVVVFAASTYSLLHQPTRQKMKRSGQEIIGVCAVALERSHIKNARKAEVLELLAEHGELGNEDIRQHLGVSARSVVNYMNELEAEGNIQQIGDTGRGVTYRLTK